MGRLLETGSKVQLGDVATWLTAGVTAVALYFAYRAVRAAGEASRTAIKLYKLESDRDREAAAARQRGEDDAVRVQAAKVCGWYGAEIKPGLAPKWGCFLRNASELPVYDVRVTFHFRTSGQVHPERGHHDLPVLPPASEATRVPAPEAMLREVDSAEPYVVSIAFRDAAGRNWRRDTSGLLAEQISGE